MKYFLSIIASAILLVSGCASSPVHQRSGSADLSGAWRANIQFKDGAFAAVKDLEFMYVFNAGGTMTESSNYDSAPPVPPAYGVWRRTGPRQFEAKYVFCITKPPASFDEVTKGGGWVPNGRGVLVERITLSEDGRTFKSVVTYDAFDQNGKAVETGSVANGEALRMGF